MFALSVQSYWNVEEAGYTFELVSFGLEFVAIYRNSFGSSFDASTHTSGEQPTEKLADDITENYATNFSIGVSQQEVMIFFGKLTTTIKDGNIQPDEVEYHTKIQMSHEAARDLSDLLAKNIGEGVDAREGSQ